MIIIILITSLFGQFGVGTISAGALFSYSSADYGGEYSENETLSAIGTKYTSNTTIQPTVSYFIQSNLSLDFYIGVNSREQENCYGSSYGGIECDIYATNLNILGGGGTYYVNNIYGGMGVAKIISEGDEYSSRGKYLEFHGGYLHRLDPNIYLDIGFSQLSGIGQYETESGGSSCVDYGECQDNEYTQFDFKVGIKAFFSL